MGYRVLVVACLMSLICGCSAFDNSSEPYEGVPEDQVQAAQSGGVISTYTGYYAGDKTLDTNTCTSVTDEVGAAVPLSLDIAQSDVTIGVTFEDGQTASGALDTDKTIVMLEDASVKQVYYLTFTDGAVDGSSEVIEADENGQFGDPCATYTIALEKGEKPAEDAAKADEKKADKKADKSVGRKSKLPEAKF